MLSVIVARLGIVIAVAITQSPMNRADPVVSRDGKHIVYSANGEGWEDLYVVNADGTGVSRITHDSVTKSRGRWSTDGSLMYSTFANDTSTIHSIAADGSRHRVIGRVAGRNPLLLDDGNTVVYSTGGWTTMQINTTTLGKPSGPRISDGTGAIWNVAVSPDQKRLAYTLKRDNQMGIWTMNLDGSDARPLSKFLPSDGDAQCPSWSADGKFIAVQASVRDPTDAKRSITHVWTIDVRTGQATKLGAHSATYDDELPVWFPDGKRIAFQSNRSGHFEVWTMNSDGTDQKQLTR